MNVYKKLRNSYEDTESNLMDIKMPHHVSHEEVSTIKNEIGEIPKS